MMDLSGAKECGDVKPEMKEAQAWKPDKPMGDYDKPIEVDVEDIEEIPWETDRSLDDYDKPIGEDVLPDRDYDKPIEIDSGDIFEKPWPGQDVPPFDPREYLTPEEKAEQIEKNRKDGKDREAEVKKELEEQYPESEGYQILSEVYLRDEDGNIVKDPETGEARRIDFVVVDKDGKVVDSVEVTSQTAPKDEQSAKENRIRENGGNYVRMPDGTLAEIPSDVQTRIERRD